MNLIDPRALGKVVVLFGGKSAEREVSLSSGSMVLASLQRSGVQAFGFDPAIQNITELVGGQFDRAIIALHGRYGEDGVIQGVLECLEIPYTGSGVSASAVAMDKILTKVIWLHAGLNTPDYCQLTPGFDAQKVASTLSLPLIVKPAQEGSTLGLTKVKTLEELQPAFDQAYQYDKIVLAEKFVKGQELTVTILGQGESAQVLPIIRIQAPDDNYDYHNKYIGNETQYFCPSGLSVTLESQIKDMAKQAYNVIGCSGWGRVDVLLDEEQKPWLLEVNTSPGMTDHSLVPLSAKAAGIRYDELVLTLAKSASLKTSGGNKT